MNSRNKFIFQILLITLFCKITFGFKIQTLEYVHMMTGEMNSYRFKISNRCENKFCLHDVPFRLHFKTTRYIDGHAQEYDFGQCLHHILSPKMKFHFCQNDRNEITPAVSFKVKRTCALNTISDEYAFIHFTSGKFCSHENLMPVSNFISVKMTDMKSMPV